MNVSDDDMRAALGRIALTADGELLYRWLQKELQRVSRSVDQSTLQCLEGRRTFAHDLMGHMVKGIDERGRAESSSTVAATERAVSFAGSKPVTNSRPRGARRRITDNTHVPGWDKPS